MFAVTAAVAVVRRWREDGICVNAAHPGAVIESRLTRLTPAGDVEAAVASGRYHSKTSRQPAATSVFLSCSPFASQVSGAYFENCQQADPDEPTAGTDAAGVAAHALDPVLADRLWDLSEQLTHDER